jgi:hypothetical protein
MHHTRPTPPHHQAQHFGTARHRPARTRLVRRVSAALTLSAAPCRVIRLTLGPGTVAPSRPGSGRRGPRPDLAVVAEDAPRNTFIGARMLQLPHRTRAHADDMVPVADRIPGGLHPRHPRMLGPVPLVPLPAQQMPDPAPGQLHDRRRPRLTPMQPAASTSHTSTIRNSVLQINHPGPPGTAPDQPPCSVPGTKDARGRRHRRGDVPARPAPVLSRSNRVLTLRSILQGTQRNPPSGGTRTPWKEPPVHPSLPTALAQNRSNSCPSGTVTGQPGQPGHHYPDRTIWRRHSSRPFRPAPRHSSARHASRRAPALLSAIGLLRTLDKGTGL